MSEPESGGTFASARSGALRVRPIDNSAVPALAYRVTGTGAFARRPRREHSWLA
jgi:hypothetical protein